MHVPIISRVCIERTATRGIYFDSSFERSVQLNHTSCSGLRRLAVWVLKLVVMLSEICSEIAFLTYYITSITGSW